MQSSAKRCTPLLPSLSVVAPVYSVMKLYEQSDSDEFDDVELEKRDKATYHCIDYASGFYIGAVLFAYLSIIVVYGLVGFTAPSKLEKAEKRVFLSGEAADAPVSIDVRLFDLQESDFAFELNCSAMRASHDDEVTYKVKMTESHRIIRDFVDLKVSEPETREVEIAFRGRRLESEPFRIVPVLVNGFDSIAVKLTLALQDASIESLKFSYYYMNPACIRFRQTTRNFMSAAILYCLFVFLSSGHSFSQTSLLAVVLGVLGALASNPLGRFLSNESAPNAWLGVVFMAVFVNFFKFFVLCQLNMMRNKRESVSSCFLLVSGVFFSVSTVVDVRADWQRDQTIMKYASSQNDWSVSDAEVHRYLCLALYTIAWLWMIGGISCTEAPDRDTAKAFCFVVVILVPLLCIVVGRGVLDALDIGQLMSFPDLIIDTSYMLGAAACLLWTKPVTLQDMDKQGRFILESDNLGY